MLRHSLLAALCGTFFLAYMGSAQADPQYVPAFVNLVKSQSFDQANYYISRGYITPEDINSAQIISDVANDLDWKIQANTDTFAKLITYLGSVAPIDLNTLVSCRSDYRCSFASRLVETGQPLPVIQYFVGLGLDLNKRFPGLAPVEVMLLAHLGSVYSIADLNSFAQLGLGLGSAPVPVGDLGGITYSMFEQNRYQMPENYLLLPNFNLMDLIVLTLGSLDGHDGPTMSAKSQVLCDFVIYAAQSYAPSFDYLDYLLRNRDEFRAANVGIASERSRSVFFPFPQGCITLVRSMAANHIRLVDIMDRFAVQGDVATAEWLLAATQPAQ